MSESASALIVILHGSPIATSADPVKKMLKVIQGTLEFPNAMIAYLECNEPSIEQAMRQCIANGVTQITIVPYLLHRGRHMVLDVPDQVRSIAAQHPEVQVHIAPPVGETDSVTRALHQRIQRADTSN